MQKFRIEVEKVRKLYFFILTQLNLPEKEIEIVADAAIFASLRGIDSHGFIRTLSRVVKEVRAGIVKPNTQISILKETKSGALVDANMGLGPVSAIKCMELAIKKAEDSSCGVVVACNCNHFGVASYYATKALERDMIGVVFCNASPSTAPFGGREAIHGTNPVSFAIPAGDHDPLVIDFSTSSVSRGKIIQALKEGKRIPEGWALNRNGYPTTDPKEALEGVLLPMGGYKGYGLGLVVDVFTAALAGSLIGREIPPYLDLSTPYGASYFMMAINIESFAGVCVFKQKVDRLIRDCKSCSPQEGFKEVLVPGEIELRVTKERERRGIPVRKEEWDEMIGILKSNNVKPGSWENLFI